MYLWSHKMRAANEVEAAELNSAIVAWDSEALSSHIQPAAPGLSFSAAA